MPTDTKELGIISMTPARKVCQFSCGAASAVATKLTLAKYPGEVEIINAFIVEEHTDNRRFLADCEKWFGQTITVLRDDKYGASIREVFKKKRFMGGFKFGAPCSRALKKELLDAWRKPDDIMVLGYTIEERGRFERFLDANNEIKAIAPLIDANLGKADCLAIVQNAGIELPMMYRLGYHNANCIGCVKGGEGYWNKIRRDFLEQFNELADIQESIGPGANLFRDRKTGVRYSLRELPPDKGRYQDEPPISCSFFCEMAEKDIEN